VAVLTRAGPAVSVRHWTAQVDPQGVVKSVHANVRGRFEIVPAELPRIGVVELTT
jgi:hypothetical protein